MARLNWIPYVYLLVTWLPFSAGAVGTCRDMFVPRVSELRREIMKQVAHGDRTVSDESLGSDLITEAIERIHEIDAKYHIEDSPYGGNMIVFEPDSQTEYGRLAARIEKAYGAKLAFDAEEVVRFGATAFVRSVRHRNGKYDLTLFLGADPLFSDGRLLRDLAILHEIRHLRLFTNEANGLASAFHGEVQAMKGLIPYELDPKEPDYGDFLSFSEMLTFHSQLRISLLKLRAAIRSKQSHEAALEEALADVETAMTYRSIVAHRAAASLKAVKKSDPSFIDGEAVLIGHQGDAFLRVTIPLVDKSVPKAEALALQMKSLSRMADFMMKQSKRFLAERPNLRVLENVDQLLRELPTGPQLGVKLTPQLTSETKPSN